MRRLDDLEIVPFLDGWTFLRQMLFFRAACTEICEVVFLWESLAFHYRAVYSTSLLSGSSTFRCDLALQILLTFSLILDLRGGVSGWIRSPARGHLQMRQVVSVSSDLGFG